MVTGVPLIMAVVLPTVNWLSEAAKAGEENSPKSNRNSRIVNKDFDLTLLPPQSTKSSLSIPDISIFKVIVEAGRIELPSERKTSPISPSAVRDLSFARGTPTNRLSLRYPRLVSP